MGNSSTVSQTLKHSVLLLYADTSLVGYTGVFNVLDYACVSFPTGMAVNKDIDTPLGDGHQPLSEICKDIHLGCKFINYISLVLHAEN